MAGGCQGRPRSKGGSPGADYPGQLRVETRTAIIVAMSVFVIRQIPGKSCTGVLQAALPPSPTGNRTAGSTRTRSIAVYGKRKTSTHLGVDTYPYLATLPEYGVGGMFIFGLKASGSARSGVIAVSNEDAEALGRYLLEAVEALTGLSQSRHGTAALAYSAAPAPAWPGSLLRADPAATLTQTPEYPAAGRVPLFAPAGVVVPSYGCAFELPYRMGLPMLERSPWDDWPHLSLRGYARGGGRTEPVYVISVSGTDPAGPWGKLYADFAMPLGDLAQFAHAVLDAVTEYSGRLTDR
jgi:hypothetical protein